MTLEDKLAQQRHNELLAALEKVAEVLGDKGGTDKLNDLISDNVGAIKELAISISEWQEKEIIIQGEQSDPDTALVLSKVAQSLTSIVPVINGIQVRLEALESKPRPVRLVAERDRAGNLQYINVEYL